MLISVEASLAAGPAAPVAVISEDWAAPRAAPAPPVKPAPAVELSDKRIKQAVAATIAAAPDRQGAPANRQDALRAPTLSAQEYQKFAEGFANAEVPHCLDPDGLRLQPPRIGMIGFSGLLAIPFVLIAAVRGKCK